MEFGSRTSWQRGGGEKEEVKVKKVKEEKKKELQRSRYPYLAGAEKFAS